MGTWQPSTAPKHWNTPHLLLNKFTVWSKSLPVGNFIYSFSSTSTIALQVSCTILHTDNHATQNRWLIVRYSARVAKHHYVIATLCCTEMEQRITVSCLINIPDNLLHMYKKVSLLIQKLFNQSWWINVLNTMFFHHVSDLYYVYS